MARHTDVADDTRFAGDPMSVWSPAGRDQWVHDDTGDLVEVREGAGSGELYELAERARAHVELFEMLAREALRDERGREQCRKQKVEESIRILSVPPSVLCPNREHSTHHAAGNVRSMTNDAYTTFHCCNDCGHRWATR